MKRKIRFISILLGLFIALTVVAYAYSYNYQFLEYFGWGDIASANSPYRNTDGTGYFGNITSNNNQPRDIGTILHNGTDLGHGGYPNRLVYAIMSGTVQYVYNGGDNSYVLVNHNGYYIKYQHITPRSGLTQGTTVTANDYIGSLLNYSYGGNHLHMVWSNSSGSLSQKLLPFYGHVSAWDYGQKLDYLTRDAFNTDNSFYITAKYLNGGATYDLSSIEMYYRINGGAWQGPAYLSQTFPDIDRWSINIRTATGASPGQTVDFYLAGIANISTSYKWGLWPQYYSEPPKTPAQFSADGRTPLYYSYTIR